MVPAQQRSSVLCEVFASNSGSWRWFQRKSHLGWRSGRHDPSGGGEVIWHPNGLGPGTALQLLDLRQRGRL